MNCFFCQKSMGTSNICWHHNGINPFHGFNFTTFPLNNKYVAFVFPNNLCQFELNINQVNYGLFQKVLYRGELPSNFSCETAMEFLNKLLKLKAFL